MNRLLNAQQQSDTSWKLTDGTILTDAEYQAELAASQTAPNNPAPAANDTDLIRMQNLILQEQARKLQEELEATRIRNTPAPSTPPPLAPGDTYNEPEKLMSRIEQMMEAQIRPLREANIAFQKQNAYATLKHKVKSQNPQHAAQFVQIEPLVDQFMEGQEPTEANLVVAVQRALGVAVSQGLFRPITPSNPTPSPAPNSQPPKPVNGNPPPADHSMLPPHLRPSNTPSNSSSSEAPIDLSQFDENQKRLMRENGQTPRQYILMRDTPPNKLLTKEFQDAYKKAGERRD